MSAWQEWAPGLRAAPFYRPSSLLVGMHGAHVTSGLLWLAYMVAQVVAKGLRPHVLRRLLCFSLFWHALDMIWVGVLTAVYLMGAR